MVREHQGTLHEVMVVPGGFSWQDETYPSLSTIAQAITGTSWNGPRFFGLRGGSSPEVAVEPVAVVNDQSRVSSRSSNPAGAHRRAPRVGDEDGDPEAAALRHPHAQIDSA
jgi:hypothetical protein